MIDKEIAIKVENVSKTFRIPHEKISTIRGAFVNLFRSNGFEEFKALDDVSFEVKKGEFFGIIGRNGSGKSTLLKVLAGIYKPDRGKVKINGLISPFLELGIGFNPELSGRDNIFLNATVLGLSQKQIDEKFDDIVEFSELRRFIDQKVKNYSSGMQVRLAFSVAIHANREILLMDEVLAVGDSNFQKKCFEMFDSLKAQGKTIVFVTHAMDYARQYCDRVVLLHHGKVVVMGNTEKAIDQYEEINLSDEERRLKEENKRNEELLKTSELEASKLKKEEKGEEKDKDAKEIKALEIKIKEAKAREIKNKESISGRYGNRKAAITNFKILDSGGKESFNLETGKKFKIVFDIRFNAKAIKPVFGVMLRKTPRENLFGIHSYLQNRFEIGGKEKGDIVQVSIEDMMILNPGIYYVTPAVANYLSKINYESLDVLDNFKKINVHGQKEHWGLVYSKPTIECQQLK